MNELPFSFIDTSSVKQRKWNTVVPVTAVLKTWIELFHLYRVTKLKTYDSNVFLNLLKAENGKRFYFLSLATSVSVIPKETSLTIPFDILAEKNFLIKICLMKGLNIEIVSTLHSYVNFRKCSCICTLIRPVSFPSFKFLKTHCFQLLPRVPGGP